MLGYQPFDEIYERLIEWPSMAYRSAVGPPLNLDPAAFEQFLARLSHFREDYPNMAFWQMVDYKTLTISHSQGDLEAFGYKLTSVKDFFRRGNTDYLLPYLRWRTAACRRILKPNDPVEQLHAVVRVRVSRQPLYRQYFCLFINTNIF